MNDLGSLTIPELTDYLKTLGEPSYRASQIFDWLHKRGAISFDEMTNLPKPLREKLSEDCVLREPVIRKVQESKIDGTRKYLLELEDGNLIEAVRMRYEYGDTVCISSQAGCRMGCAFCASGIGGLKRNLTASEMLGEIAVVEKDTGSKLSHIVVMGTGEPLDNYDNLVRFIELVSDEKGRNLSQRNITVSTCGIVPKIRELADRRFQITLAISLHAVTDEKRRRIMPVAKSYSIRELTEACRYYFDRTGRRLSLEYALIAGNNDTDEDAEGLSSIAKSLGAHVNLIPVNPVTEAGMKRPKRAAVLNFRDRLLKRGVNVTVRRELGSDIDGACGQLRHRDGIPADLQ
ncbi:MAG: 23S rRNA (adenine(2503)-C(2))-methyltransferase RlmN [Lachnospiraceae bacterium]|nr:23S rRNA (adenine(2503)-C(2))-methyltransferase RlmN [Lachnospiraceae bacterium]